MDNIIENNENKPPEFEKEIIHNSLEVLQKYRYRIERTFSKYNF